MKFKEFKVEDKVYNSRFGNGKVIHISDLSDDTLPILVEYDKSHESLHNGSSDINHGIFGKDGHCFWHTEDTIVLCDETICNTKYAKHLEICKKFNKTYIEKNIAYGDSFSKSFKKFGIISALVRIEDKWNRIESLAQGAENNVKDESIKDTLLDMANYCIMTYMEIDKDEKTVLTEGQAKEGH